MRVISATTEREALCPCGARLSFWPADVTTTTVEVERDTERDRFEGAVRGVTILGEFREVRIVRCPCCGAMVEVGT